MPGGGSALASAAARSATHASPHEPLSLSSQRGGRRGRALVLLLLAGQLPTGEGSLFGNLLSFDFDADHVDILGGVDLSSGLLKLAWQQLGTHLMVLDAGWLHTVERCRDGARGTVTGASLVVSDVKIGPSSYIIDTVPSRL